MKLIQTLAELAQPILTSPYVLRTRRNHGLEHATIHVLNRQRYALSGRSTDSGFVIVGNVPTDKLEEAVHEALGRMRAGQHGLAIHPNCGTNLVTTGFMATLVAALGFGGRRQKPVGERFPIVMVSMMLVILFSPTLGTSIQRHITTEGNPGDLEIVSISRKDVTLPFRGRSLMMHQVVTRQR